MDQLVYRNKINDAHGCDAFRISGPVEVSPGPMTKIE